MTAQNDVSDKPITITWKGKTYRLKPASEWNIEVLEAMEDGKMTGILRGVLEGDGYARLRATKPLVTELEELFGKIQKALGISGN